MLPSSGVEPPTSPNHDSGCGFLWLFCKIVHESPAKAVAKEKMSMETGSPTQQLSQWNFPNIALYILGRLPDHSHSWLLQAVWARFSSTKVDSHNPAKKRNVGFAKISRFFFQRRLAVCRGTFRSTTGCWLHIISGNFPLVWTGIWRKTWKNMVPKKCKWRVTDSDTKECAGPTSAHHSHNLVIGPFTHTTVIHYPEILRSRRNFMLFRSEIMKKGSTNSCPQIGHVDHFGRRSPLLVIVSVFFLSLFFAAGGGGTGM